MSSKILYNLYAQKDISNQLIKSFEMSTYLPYLADFSKIHVIIYVVDIWIVGRVCQIGTHFEALDELV